MMSSTSEIEDEEFECDSQDNESTSFVSEDDAANGINNMELVITERKQRLFTAAQSSVLKKFYVTGMRGTGERYLPLIANAEKETGLTTDQIKAS
jgi:hypothetical protein